MLVTDFIVIALGLMVIALWIYFRRRRSRKEQTLRQRGLSKRWCDYLFENVTLYRGMPPGYREQLHGYINIFLHDKQFIGCAGLEISDEIRLTIATQACILLLNRECAVFPDFHSVLVYPSAYYAEQQVVSDGLVISNEISVRVGESWPKGIIVLSWDEVLNNSLQESPGHNVVIHEFAHRLDQQNTSSEGVPLLSSESLYHQWASVLGNEFQALQNDLRQGQETVIDPYGASSPAEFFAVVSEQFFELPNQLYSNHPELYDQLREYYRLNPKQWSHNVDDSPEPMAEV